MTAGKLWKLFLSLQTRGASDRSLFQYVSTPYLVKNVQLAIYWGTPHATFVHRGIMRQSLHLQDNVVDFIRLGEEEEDGDRES